MNRCILFLISMLAVSTACRAQVFSSGPTRIDLIELFTSEGCSSCPPADRRMNALAGKDGLWKEFVPVAFHVDYWNYLGWPDPYSSADYSTRQRRYTREWRARTSYTPCFVVNGVTARRPASTGGIDRAGLLKAMIEEDKATITFTPSTSAGKYIAWLAPLSGKLSTQVPAGENRGRKLEHWFVALGLVSTPMTASDRGIYSATLAIPSDARTKAVAVWISRPDSLQSLQATGGWLK